MADPGKLFLFVSRYAEALRRYRHWPAFGVVDADLAMVKVVGLLDDHAARVKLQKPAFHFCEIVDLQTDMMQAGVHVHFAERRTLLEKCQIVKAVGDGDIALGRAAQLFGAEKPVVEIHQLRGLFSEIGDVAKCCHNETSCEDWSN